MATECRVLLAAEETMSTHSQLVGRLRFRQLALLAALGEHRNLHRAAQAVHLAQPSATKLVHDLEQLFGVPLFERQPRGMTPTEMGAEVLEFAKRSLIDLRRFTEDLDHLRRGGDGQLTIGTCMGAIPDLVANAICDLKKARPRLSIRLRGERNDEIVNLLLDGAVDLAVGRFTHPLQHNLIHNEVLGDENFYIVARANHPLASGQRLRLAQLGDQAWILQPLASPTRQIVEQEFGLAGMRTPADFVECGSVFATLQLLRASDALTLLPESVVRDHLRAGLLVRLPVAVGRSLPGFGILTRRGEPLSSTVCEFIEALRKHRAPEAIPRTWAIVDGCA
jgi:DNA-binding transcriptional LysR family regulator